MMSGPDPRVTTLIAFDVNAPGAGAGTRVCTAGLQAATASAAESDGSQR
jgi:hypothetical protein